MSVLLFLYLLISIFIPAVKTAKNKSINIYSRSYVLTIRLLSLYGRIRTKIMIFDPVHVNLYLQNIRKQKWERTLFGINIAFRMFKKAWHLGKYPPFLSEMCLFYIKY